jgi:hypothetical protein
MEGPSRVCYERLLTGQKNDHVAETHAHSYMDTTQIENKKWTSVKDIRFFFPEPSPLSYMHGCSTWVVCIHFATLRIIRSFLLFWFIADARAALIVCVDNSQSCLHEFCSPRAICHQARIDQQINLSVFTYWLTHCKIVILITSRDQHPGHSLRVLLSISPSFHSIESQRPRACNGLPI